MVGAVMVGAILIYFSWFWVFNSKSLSIESDGWGQFGDFLGGLLNPIVAYAAFYWLSRSVRLQKEELHETRVALAEASEAQTEQAEHARVSVRLNALSTLTNSISSEVEMQRLQLQFLVGQISSRPGGGGAYLLTGEWLSTIPLNAYIARINSQIEKRMTERYENEQEILRLLAKHQLIGGSMLNNEVQHPGSKPNA